MRDNTDSRHVVVHLDPNGGWRYTGGVNDNGDLKGKSTEDAVDFRIDVVGPGYTIQDIELIGDTKGQLSLDRVSDDTMLIHDLNTMEMSARYCVLVRAQDGRVIRCDPMIGNEPRGR